MTFDKQSATEINMRIVQCRRSDFVVFKYSVLKTCSVIINYGPNS